MVIEKQVMPNKPSDLDGTFGWLGIPIPDKFNLQEIAPCHNARGSRPMGAPHAQLGQNP